VPPGIPDYYGPCHGPPTARHNGVRIQSCVVLAGLGLFSWLVLRGVLMKTWGVRRCQQDR
jgi:hypothetical protein